ncbi:MAG: hypothetical protein WEB03_03035 [Nitriliruptor sp.]|uniref:hypothetical protein n=1 Tax=Nitriliruptor sp. TaxID=2448056 RepID=UPI0034A06F37
MDPKAIIAALPWLRRAWRIVPGPLRVPLLLIAAVIGVVQFIQGRKAEQAEGAAQGGATGADPRSPAGQRALTD